MLGTWPALPGGGVPKLRNLECGTVGAFQIRGRSKFGKKCKAARWVHTVAFRANILAYLQPPFREKPLENAIR